MYEAWCTDAVRSYQDLRVSVVVVDVGKGCVRVVVTETEIVRYIAVVL